MNRLLYPVLMLCLGFTSFFLVFSSVKAQTNNTVLNGMVGSGGSAALQQSAQSQIDTCVSNLKTQYEKDIKAAGTDAKKKAAIEEQYKKAQEACKSVSGANAAQANTSYETKFPQYDGNKNTPTLQNLLKADSLAAFVSRLLEILFIVIGLVAVIVILYGAGLIVFSAGNESQVSKGKSAIVWAVIGVALALLAYSIVAIIQNIGGLID